MSRTRRSPVLSDACPVPSGHTLQYQLMHCTAFIALKYQFLAFSAQSSLRYGMPFKPKHSNTYLLLHGRITYTTVPSPKKAIIKRRYHKKPRYSYVIDSLIHFRKWYTEHIKS